MLKWPGADAALCLRTASTVQACPPLTWLCVLEPTHLSAQADAFFDTAFLSQDYLELNFPEKFPKYANG